MQLGRVLGRLTAGGKMGDGQARGTGEKLSWSDICFACAGSPQPFAWGLALLKYQGDSQVYAETEQRIIDWAAALRWHEYAPVGKRWQVPHDTLQAMVRAALKDYISDRPNVSTSELARWAQLSPSIFNRWRWVFTVISQHLSLCESELESSINKRLH